VGRGDLRNIGGQTVHVTYQDWAFDTQNQVYNIINVDGPYTVLQVVRAIKDDGTAEDTWTVSSTGQYAQTHDGVLIGALDQITALGASITTYPHRYTLTKTRDIDTGHSVALNIRPDNSIVRHHYALLSVIFEGVRHTLTDVGHTQDVITAPTNHDVAAVPHDVAALASWHFQTGGVDHGTGGVNYNPTPTLNITTNPPAGAVPVMFDGRFFYATVHGSVPVPADTLQIFQSNPTTSGTGGKVVATTGAASGTGQIGGTVPKKTHPATGGFGAQLARATSDKVTDGPLPTGVSVWVDNVLRFSSVTNGATLDILPYVGDNAGHLVEARAATIGAVDLQLDISVDITTTALKPTGA
jgi:hypothetical protein